MTSVAIIGNCQIEGIARSLRAMIPDFDIRVVRPKDILGLELDPSTKLVLVQHEYLHKVRQVLAGKPADKIERVYFPGIYFTAFHPDFVLVRTSAGRLMSPTGGYCSAIAVYAWKNGFSVDETIDLFKEDVFRELGYFDHWRPSATKLIDDGRQGGMDLESEIARWKQEGCFLHCPNHPKLTPLAGLARMIVAKLDLTPRIRYPEKFLDDPLVKGIVWPQYPEIASRLGLEGEYVFRGPTRLKDMTQECLDLEQYVASSFAIWATEDAGGVSCERFNDPKLEQIFRFRKTRSRTARALNPYSDIRDYQLWQRAVVKPAVSELDPMTHAKFTISKSDRIATAGSCFAQHISRALNNSGYNYFVVEDGGSLPASQAVARNYGVFSARYGNIYSVRQLVQLLDRSEGHFVPSEDLWQREDGRCVDPFRPQVEPDAFADGPAVEAARREHLACVRRMWRECDVFVFTLGLTETWSSAQDGAVFPLAPGVAGGRFDPLRHQFHNMTVEETIEDLQRFLAKLRALNPKVRVILTVSPVPLIATAEDRHVLVSTTYSKAVLVAAAQEVARGESQVQYFPSFEIITGMYNRGRYFDTDLRSVTAEGVSHVVGVFLKHFSEPGETRDDAAADSLQQELRAGLAIVCDEEEIERAVG